MKQLASFVDSFHPSFVSKLHKSLYGLKQVPHAWYIALRQSLLQLGFKNSALDCSLFIYNFDGITIDVLVYVDDLILTGNNQTHLHQLVHQLGVECSLKELQPLHYFLGIEVILTTEGLFLTQQKYVQDLLDRTCMDGAKYMTTPLSTSVKLHLGDGSPPVDCTEFRRIISALQYLSFTRPNISFAVNKLAQFMHNPSSIHWQATKSLLRYLTHIVQHSILLQQSSPIQLRAFLYADWVGNQDDRTSTTAYLLFLGSNFISWRTREQKAVA
ncbi:hypothetical protein F2P56_018789 [Juglans regia]|uniref:Reverse transcriptase Ty1/copia-type domain-containing protein n=1 Tax=Juglans regia TaxID=51240 RepID=A0A833UNV5_JUGRE|nr:hypothetical protein F2P56_018789 [Juglans regia]